MATSHDYSTALSALHEAIQEVDRLGTQLRTFADRMLAFPHETCFVDIEGEAAPTLDQLMPGARWYAAEFPGPERLQAALRRRLEARQQALKVWDEMTPAQRNGAPRVPA